jgi:hypothetical protein
MLIGRACYSCMFPRVPLVSVRGETEAQQCLRRLLAPRCERGTHRAPAVANGMPHSGPSIHSLMDPLSVTASVIAVATLTWHSCKAAYDVVDRLGEAPHVIARSKSSLFHTQEALRALRVTLARSDTPNNKLDSVLRMVELEGALKSAQGLCDEFAATVTVLTSRSKDGRLSGWDRVLVALRESKINQFNKELSDFQRTITLLILSITL